MFVITAQFHDYSAALRSSSVTFGAIGVFQLSGNRIT